MITFKLHLLSLLHLKFIITNYLYQFKYQLQIITHHAMDARAQDKGQVPVAHVLRGENLVLTKHVASQALSL